MTREILELTTNSNYFREKYSDFSAIAKDKGWLHALQEVLESIPIQEWGATIDGERITGRMVTIDELQRANGGVCRHFATFGGLIVERAIKKGSVNAKVYYVRGEGHGWLVVQSTNSGKVYIIDRAQKKYGEMTNDMKYYGGIDKEGNKIYLPYSKDVYKAVPELAPLVQQNPKKKIHVRIQESTNPEKKLMAIFTKPNGKTKTTHFGARGMSDYTQHKDKDRMKNYLARHGKMGENWNDPTTAGALSRWILWGKPSLRESFNDFKKRFNLEGVMAVTNTKMNPRIPKKYEGQDPSEHSDLYTDEDPEGTIQGLGFKDAETAKKSIRLIKKADRTHAHKIQAAMAMEQRARFHPNATKGIKEAQKIYAAFIEEMKEKTKEMRNPSKTPEGRKIPKKYLKGLNKEEMAIAAKEIDKGYKYDIDDPEAYEYWKSDIKATARGYKTVPSKYKKKFIEMYGPLPEEGKFLDKMAKATKIKKSILEKVYDKGLAAWRGGHRPGVQQHQWAAGRVYSFVTLGNTVKKGKKKMPDYSLAVEAGLIKKNPSKYREAAGAIVMEGDRILLLRRSTKETSKHGLWEFPGGKLEEDETAEQAAIIETQEESGLDVVVKGKAGEHIDHGKEKVYHAFFVEPTNVNQEVKLSEEHDQSLWVTIDEALAMEESKLSHHARHFLERMVRNNPSWRHGEFAEDDPFEDEFE